MADPIVSSKTLDVLQGALQGLALRQQVIGQNLANVDTPGYKASYVSFEEQLKRQTNPSTGELAMERTNGGHLAAPLPSEPVIALRPSTTFRNDGNSVDIDKEMVDLAETALRYQSLSQVASRQLATLRTAIQER